MTTTREKNLAKVHRFRTRQRERREAVKDLSSFMLREELFEDIDIRVEPTPRGTMRVTFDMSRETDRVLREYAMHKGVSLDDILTDAIQRTLARTARRLDNIKVTRV